MLAGFWAEVVDIEAAGAADGVDEVELADVTGAARVALAGIGAAGVVAGLAPGVAPLSMASGVKVGAVGGLAIVGFCVVITGSADAGWIGC